jgi:hypothetical protein
MAMDPGLLPPTLLLLGLLLVVIKKALTAKASLMRPLVMVVATVATRRNRDKQWVNIIVAT